MKLLEFGRKNIIYICILVIAIILIASGICYALYSGSSQKCYIKYDDYSDIDYNVILKENDFYNQEYLVKDRQYIASLIDHIDAKFKYNVTVDEDFKYQYKYKIVANVNVIDNDTNKVIYDLSEDIITDVFGEKEKTLKIDENVKIDFNKYNDLISKFVTGYKLRDVTSSLIVSMHVGVAGTTEELGKEESVMSINIPLTTDTVAIDVNHDLTRNIDSLIALKQKQDNSKMLLFIAIILLVLDFGLTIGLVIYSKLSLTEEDKYKNKLSKILNLYGTYISEVEDEFDMKDYQILKVKKFVDLLEIRDTMHIPIIMIENKDNLVTCFVIPTTNNILYFYSLGVTQYALSASSSEEDVEEDVEEIIWDKETRIK